MRIDFCIPVYNEGQILEENTKKLLAYLLNLETPYEWKIFLIMNGCTDNSLEIAKSLVDFSPGLIETMEVEGRGKGTALKDFLLKSEADIVAYMDSDLAVDLENIPDLLKPLIEGSHEMAMGSRLLNESSIERSFYRELTSQGYIYFSRLILGHSFSDLQCGFKAMKMDKFRDIFPRITNKSWFFDTELIVLAHKKGLPIKEVPVHWEENRYDQRKSKIHVFRDGINFLWETFKLRYRIIKNKLFN